MGVDVSVVILPEYSWREARPRWEEAQQRGFSTAWTYDHLTWRTLRDGPWFAPLPLLSAVATVTTSLRLGTLVASPNFRHPATLAKEAMTLDDLSGGRLELGLGAGGSGWDATALGSQAPTGRDRTARFEDFVTALDEILRTPAGSYSGPCYRAPDFRTLPGCVQRPRVPFTIAAAGPRALRLAARYASCWVTFGATDETKTPQDWYAALRHQSERLTEECLRLGRSPDELRRMVLVSLDQAWAQSSVAAWDDFAGHIAQLGFSDVALHWPRSGSDLPGMSPAVLDAVSRG